MPAPSPSVPPAGPAQSGPRQRRWRTWLWRLVIGGLSTLAVALLLAWAVLQWGILPRLNEQWRPMIEARVSRAIGLQLRIASIEAGPGWWNRVLTLRDVVLQDSRGETALRLQQVQLALSPASLLPRSLTRWSPRFQQVLIDQPQLEVRRDTDGHWHVAGVPLGSARDGPDDPRIADWVFSQSRVTVRGGQLSWTDELRQAPVLVLNAVDIELRNRLNQHALTVQATPPDDWGARFTLQADLKGPLIADGHLARPGDWRRWAGTLDLLLPQASLGELRRHLALPFDLQQGRGTLKLKAQVQGLQVERVSADLALNDLQLQFARTQAPLQLQQLAVQLDARRVAAPPNAPAGAVERLEVSAHALRFTTGDGVVWPAADLFVAWFQDAAGQSLGGDLQAQRLDLATLAQLAGRVPLSEPLRQWIEQGQPQGVVQPLQLGWTGAVDTPQRYTLSGQAAGLSLQGLAPPAAAASGTPGRPGVRNGAVEFSATEAGGQAKVRFEHGALDLPGVFEEPLVPLDRLEAQLRWTVGALPADGTARPLEVQVREGRFANADLQGELNGVWRSGGGIALPGLIDLEVQLQRGQAARVARYLPLGLAAGARQYVAAAVRAGQLKNVQARVKGALSEFPFAGRPGEFRIRAQVEDATLASMPAPAGQSPAWPLFTQLRGELLFDRLGMEFRNAQARLTSVGSGQFQLQAVNGSVKDFQRDPVLVLDGQGRGPLADALAFLEASPVGGWTGHALARASARGDAALQLGLRIPLSGNAGPSVRGQVQLAGNELRLQPEVPLMTQVRGRVDFSETGFSVRGVGLRMLGGDTTLEGGTQADGSVRLSAEGSISAEALRQAGELGPVSKLAGSLSGQTPYRLTLAIAQGLPELQVTSNLVGVASKLPAPLAKTAEQALPLRVDLRHLAAGKDGAREQLRVELSTLLQVQLLHERGTPEPRLLRGGIGVGEAAPTPDSGLDLAVNLPALSIDAWRTWAGSGPAAPTRTAEAAPPLPDRVSLRVRELTAFGRVLQGVTASASRGARERDGSQPWRVQIESDQASGRIEYREGGKGSSLGPEGRVFARLTRLSLPKTDTATVETLLDQTPSVPALDVVVDDFELRGKRLGRLEIEAANQGSEGTAREWQLSRFNLRTPDAVLTARGTWTPVNSVSDPALRVGSRRRTSLSFQLALNDSGATLARLGLPGTMRGGKGQINGDIGWFGSPLSPDYGSLTGDLAIKLASGQFLKADPGAARLLGVLSLQALPRRLLLDFRDVFQEGFSFDSLEGDVDVQQGSASTRNLRMRGVQAVVLMEGRADIPRETQDLRVWVVPEINAGTASLAYAIINPAVGLGTFLGQLFLRKPLVEAATREFHVTGPWADPKVERVERSAAARQPGTTAGDRPPGTP